MLHNECRLLGVHDEPLDDPTSDDTLLRIEVRRGLIDQVDVGRNTQGQHNSDTLQLTTRKVLHFLVDEIVELERFVDISLELRIQECGLDLLEEQLSNSSLKFWRDLLRFHRDIERRNLDVSIGLFGSCEHLAECRLAGTVLTH